MAGVICQVCETQNADGVALCTTCGYLLAEESRPAPPPPAATRTCPACDAPVPNPTNLVCVECLEPLTPTEVSLRLKFGDKPVEVPSSGLLLGRDPDQSPVADLFEDHDNISRKHATVGVEGNGKAWVRDEHSTNGTFVNNMKVAKGAKAALSNGDQLRMGSNMSAQVELQ